VGAHLPNARPVQPEGADRSRLRGELAGVARRLTWTFHTQPNAKWSDGKPLTAADAAWTYNTIIKFKSGPTAALSIPDLKSASAPRPDTLVLTYAHPSAAALADLQPVPILPEHVWAKYATGNGKALRTFQNNAPIVSGGPFILEKYTPRADALFKRNPTFYGPKPHIAGLALEFFDNTDAMVIPLRPASSMASSRCRPPRSPR
jgi:peptide/nickel transport system substrate-binding protein